MVFNFIKFIFTAIISFGRPLISQYIKCVSLNNQPCMTIPTITDLNPNELHYYPFTVSLGRFNGIFNILGGPSGRICMVHLVE